MGKSNVYIHNVSSSTWPGGKVGGNNYVVVTMSACVGVTEQADQGCCSGYSLRIAIPRTY
jgi:hypothetical protein